jgi:hypothetical protein
MFASVTSCPDSAYWKVLSSTRVSQETLLIPTFRRRRCFQHKANGQNNGNATKYRNTNVCVGCNERTLFLSIVRHSFVCLRCVVWVSIHYRLCLVTVRMKVNPNGRLLRLTEYRMVSKAWSCTSTCSLASRIARLKYCQTTVVSFRE